MFGVVECRGSFSEQGKQYRNECSSLIQRSLDSYRLIFQHNGISFEEAVEEGMRLYKPFVQKHDQEALEEMRGVGEGEIDEILALNSRTELIGRGKLKKENSECTTVFKKGVLGQTWDWQMLQQNSCVIIKREHKHGSYITLTEGFNLSFIFSPLFSVCSRRDTLQDGNEQLWFGRCFEFSLLQV